MVESQPVNRKKAFNMLFFLEFWERFGFYGLQAVLAGFFVRSLGMQSPLLFLGHLAPWYMVMYPSVVLSVTRCWGRSAPLPWEPWF